MSDRCQKCGAHISSPWSFCPTCGTRTQPHTQPAPPEHEKAPVKHAFSGLLFGLIVAPMCIIVGGMLCCTGLGAFLGVPVIIAGIFAPLIGPLLGIGEPRGKCPWCGVELNDVVNSPAFECHACKGKVLLQNSKFVKAA
jgi:DNA-directed RNA polymerase subunit RPC12/RpoP